MLEPKWFYPSYKKDVGEWAWILHRLGGIALTFYLLLHIFVTNRLAAGPEAFNAIMKVLSTPLFKFLEWGLWGVILFHAFNGLRIIIVDFAGAARFHKLLFWIAFVLFLVLWAAGAPTFLFHH